MDVLMSPWLLLLAGGLLLVLAVASRPRRHTLGTRATLRKHRLGRWGAVRAARKEYPRLWKGPDAPQ